MTAEAEGVADAVGRAVKANAPAAPTETIAWAVRRARGLRPSGLDTLAVSSYFV
ncbi:hypothetical protein OG588_33780 [Streptomyces prunicolor]|jgi:hypothetical protein|uniref:hypothetical protein n=1 Tax=Streptomyces prunicolor TaxID=67348 RepID=UPI00386EB892|nr:hypothetical protein OG588_33780 [Streptomyces prunicolor]